MNVRFLKARTTLAWAAAKRAVLRLVIGRSNGRRWLAALAAENLHPTPPLHWDVVEPVSRCIGCGLCDAVADLEFSPVIVAEARRPQDAELAIGHAAALRLHAQAIARVCPARVSPVAVAQLIEEHVAMRSGT